MTDTKVSARRKPWIAGLLSGLQPGLGQLYNGEPKKAVILALLPFLVLGPILAGLLIYAPLHPPYNILLPVLLAVSVLIAIVRDATRVARQQGDSYQLRSYNRWYVYVVLAALGLFVLQPFATDLTKQVISAFNLPSNSMAPTLLSGDHILIDTSVSWNGKRLERGDIIVFLFPEDETKKFVKRVIGLPGETIHIRRKTVHVNDTALDDSAYTQRIDPGFLDEQVNPRDTFGPVTVPAESYFVMGDNRDQSLDSRFFGYVQRSKVMGKMLFVYWSWDQEENRVRWERIGLRIQ
jgi:signal peptidase I